MTDELFEKVLVQLEPELAREFGYAMLRDFKKIKALEIIKNKRVNVDFFLDCKSLIEYNNSCLLFALDSFCLTQEEYNLLKEVLL